MGAPSRVEWTPEARDQLQKIHHMVKAQWSERIADRFLDLVMEFEDLVLQFPNGFQTSPSHSTLRMGAIHRNVKAIYRIDPDRILIITLLDTRADNSAWF